MMKIGLKVSVESWAQKSMMNWLLKKSIRNSLDTLLMRETVLKTVLK